MMTDQDGLHDVSKRFYDAVNAVLRGDAKPMLALWSHGDDVTYCDTTGHLIGGWPALETYWQRAADLNAAAPMKLSATANLQHIVASESELAYVVAFEQVRREGEPGVMTARATNIYRLEDGDWRLLHRHADAPPSTSASTTTEEN